MSPPVFTYGPHILRESSYNAPAAHIIDPTCSQFPVLLAAPGTCTVRVTGPMTLRGVRYSDIHVTSALADKRAKEEVPHSGSKQECGGRSVCGSHS